MADLGLTTIKANAKIRIGDIAVSTPFIKSISISRTRGQLVSTCAVMFEFKGEFKANAGAPLVIYFDNTVAWTGVSKGINIAPSLQCAGDITVRISGQDILYKLENRLITRRQKLAGLGPMAFITSVHKRTTLGYDDPPSRHDITNSSSPIEYMTPTINFREHTQFAQAGGENIQGQLHPVTKVADIISDSAKQTGGGGFILHTHEDLTLSETGGGPAVSVFSIK